MALLSTKLKIGESRPDHSRVSRTSNRSLENVSVDFNQDQRDNPSLGVYNERVSSRSSKLEPVPW